MVDRRSFIRGGAAAGAMAAAGMPHPARGAAAGRMTVMAVGDLILDAPDIDSFFEPSSKLLRSADVVIGQVEVPHTRRGRWSNPEPHSAPAADPANLAALPKAGFTIATLSGNHLFDQGPEGVLDTLATLHGLGLQTAGAGANLTEARKPAFVAKHGIRLACLQYNAVGPDLSWAAPMKAGGAYVRAVTTYVNDLAEPGGMPTGIYTAADPSTLTAMADDIRAARKAADVVVVGFHSGRAGSPAILQYQTEMTRRAVEAGAAMVFCCHPHALLGIELYRGVPIFHGLGNFVTVTTAMDKRASNAAQWSHQPFPSPVTAPPATFNPRRPRGAQVNPYYPFSEASRNTIIAQLRIDRRGRSAASFLPCWINDAAQPVPLGRGEHAARVVAYVTELTRAAGFDTRFAWNAAGTEVVITPAGG